MIRLIPPKIKVFFKSYFHYLLFFYRYLHYRIFVAFGLSFLKGILDGFGLAMFIPLLRMTSKSEDTVNGEEELGRLDFLPNFFESLGINLTILNVLLIILFFFGLKGIITFIEGYTQVIYQQLFIRKIRVKNINLLNSYAFKYFVRSDAGKIQNTFSAEVERVNMGYKSYFKSIEYGVLVLVYLLLAFSANPQFALIVALGGILSNLLFKWLFKKTKILSQNYTLKAHVFQGLLIQKVANFKYLKATGLNYLFGNKLIKKITELENVQRELGVVDSLLRALREPVTMVVVVVAILIQISYFDSDIGLIILSLLFLYRALTFLMALQEHWNRFLSKTGSLENLTSFIKDLESHKEIVGKTNFKSFNLEIDLKNVFFRFEDTLVIKDITLKIHKNETVAFVGESGSGKTTLMNLLAGLLLPTSGQIKIDNQLITDLNLQSYREKIGYISQEAPIFNDTVFNNVTFWAEKTPENILKFERAIRQAAVSDFVHSLANKKDEYLGNNGINISGGQKQRLSIARELYKDVDFLFMDEATSALDGETESEIQANIDNLKGKYTILIIAHRLSTIKNADRIVLLKNGKINSIGNFNFLINNSSLFREMVKLQGMSPQNV